MSTASFMKACSQAPSTDAIKTMQVKIKNPLRQVFDAEDKVYQFQEVYEFFRKRIVEVLQKEGRLLPNSVNIAGDPLEEVFGTSILPFGMILSCLYAQVEPVDRTDLKGSRKLECGDLDESDDCMPTPRKQRRADSPEESNSDVESVYSVQGYVTELCKNSDYYSSSSEYETMDEFEVRVHREGDVGIEYEVQSSSNDSDLHDEDSDSSSGVEEAVVVAAAALCGDDCSELDFFADSSDFLSTETLVSSSDAEMPPDDWKCMDCGSSTQKPFFRYCIKCWQERKEMLGRPPRRKKKRRKSGRSRLNVQSQTENGDDPSSSQMSASSIAGSSSVSSVSSSFPGMCITCESAPRNASLVHGKTGHQCMCYKCAKRLLRRPPRDRRCPVCNRHIQQVIQNFF